MYLNLDLHMRFFYINNYIFIHTYFQTIILMVHTLMSKPKIHSYKESFTVNTVSSEKLLQIK